MKDALPPRRRWYVPSVADLLFIYFAFAILQNANIRLMDDPSLGWNLRVADLMLEQKGFLRSDEFGLFSEGQPWVTQAWLADILLRLAYAWGGMNGIAFLTSLVLALALRQLYLGMIKADINWLVAVAWTFFAALGTSPAWAARPNIFTLLGIVLVFNICVEFHYGRISARKTLWLVPIFIVWTNMHGGFVAGVIVVLLTWFVECALAVGDMSPAGRQAARRRLRWFTLVAALGIAGTLVNPYGVGLHVCIFNLLTDPLIQSRTTGEWLPPNFASLGWWRVEILVLSFPLLLALSNKRMGMLELCVCVVWLHFALTAGRYCPLWVLLAAIPLAKLSCNVPFLRSWAAGFIQFFSRDVRHILLRNPKNSHCFYSVVFGAILLFGSRWVGEFAAHNEELIPATALDELLDTYRGERVFHSINWGGYLTWHGWELQPRFKTWIDDRIHGQRVFEEYMTIMNAGRGWSRALRDRGAELVCVPVNAPLAVRIEEVGGWREIYRESGVVIFRKED